MTGVKDVAVVDLDVRDLKLRNTINDDAACVGRLASGLRVEAGAVKEETERGVLRNLFRSLQERLLRVNGNDFRRDVTVFYGQLASV